MADDPTPAPAPQIETPATPSQPAGDSAGAGGVDMALIPAKYHVEGDPAASLQKWAQGHSELEKSYTQSRQEASEQDAGGLKIGQGAAGNLTAEQALTAAGTSMEAAGQQIAENGELTPETYAALAKNGYGRAMVDDYIQTKVQNAQYQAATLQQQQQAAVEAVGGQEHADALLQWATSLPPAEQEQFNTRLSNPALMQGAMADLAARHAAATGAPAVIPGSGTAASSAPSGVTSQNRKETLAAAKRGDRNAQVAWARAAQEGGLKDMV
tara:strand:- start:1861 stop:2667 length:807 start_codon:yes stop_codon:yes gene_type:complete